MITMVSRKFRKKWRRNKNITFAHIVDQGCFTHKDEGLIKDEKGQDRWAKGETTARNERRYVLQMQQGTWDYKSDGIKQLKYELVSVDNIGPKAKMINVKF